MKKEFNFYKSYYAGFRTKDLLPIFSFIKNKYFFYICKNKIIKYENTYISSNAFPNNAYYQRYILINR